MSFFNNPLNDLLDKIIHSENKSSIPTISKEDRQQIRKETEDIANKIHPTLANAVRTSNNIQDSIENVSDSLNIVKVVSDQIFSKVKEDDINIGDHIYIQAPGYTHHGLYLGNNEVIHYAHDSGKNYISIRIDSISTFAENKSILKKSNYESPTNYSVSEIINRAYRRLGEQSYNLAANNCENFVRWCRHGGEDYDNS